jgi:hypothetical protein
MRGIAIMLAVTLTSVPASAQFRSKSATTTAHAVALPAGSCISSPFGPRILPNHPQAGTYHNGVDLPRPKERLYALSHRGSCSELRRVVPAGWKCWFSTIGMSAFIAISHPSLLRWTKA